MKHFRTFNMLDLRSLKDRVRSSIHTAEDLLATMMTPAQITLHVEYLKRMSGLTHEVENNLLDIDPICRDHINNAELKDFSKSMIQIHASSQEDHPRR